MQASSSQSCSGQSSSTQYSSKVTGAVLGIALGGSGLVAVSDYFGAQSKTQLLEQVKKIRSVCCLNMTGQPTDACIAELPGTLNHPESFMRMNLFCTDLKRTFDNYPSEISEKIVSSSVWGAIAVATGVVLLGWGAYVGYRSYKQRIDTILE